MVAFCLQKATRQGERGGQIMDVAAALQWNTWRLVRERVGHLNRQPARLFVAGGCPVAIRSAFCLLCIVVVVVGIAWVLASAVVTICVAFRWGTLCGPHSLLSLVAKGRRSLQLALVGCTVTKVMGTTARCCSKDGTAVCIYTPPVSRMRKVKIKSCVRCRGASNRG